MHTVEKESNEKRKEVRKKSIDDQFDTVQPKEIQLEKTFIDDAIIREFIQWL